MDSPRRLAVLVAAVVAVAAAATAQVSGTAHVPRRTAGYDNRLIAWKLAIVLARGGMSYGEPEGDEQLRRAEMFAGALTLSLPPRPIKSGDKTTDLSAGLTYVMQSAGPRISEQLTASEGRPTAALFDLGLRSALGAILYVRGKPEFADMARAIEALGKESGAPSTAWGGLASAMREGSTANEVRQALVTMIERIEMHYGGSSK
jgi:hypothetical protein